MLIRNRNIVILGYYFNLTLYFIILNVLLPVVGCGVVKVNTVGVGTVVGFGVVGQGCIVRTTIPFSAQTAVKQLPIPSVVL